ncbi:hypothetical protein BSKO_07997 [Bryopsis sp. KO-2023]|nr:hypothetical protein BSKO_07997 [Bryopsis sp. KO-2023]
MENAVEEAKTKRKDEELLILAAHHGFVEDVRALLSKGVDVNSKDKQGTSAIHFASCKSHLDIVQLLLSKGVDIDVEDGAGRTPLHYAVIGGAAEVVKLLLKKGVWIDAYDKDDDTPMHLAVRTANEAMVKLLLKGGAKLNIRNSKGLSVLGDALANKQVEMAKILMENGADFEEKAKGFSLLHLVSGLGDAPTLEFALSYLHPTKVAGPGGVTPLHCAAIGGATICIEILLQHGADPKVADEDGRTPYQWAREGEAGEDILKLLRTGSEKKKKKSTPPITEIEAEEGPEAEWSSFVKMSHAQRLKQIEAWAKSPEHLGPLGKLAFLNKDGRKAVSEVGHFMRLIECQRAIKDLQQDKGFQEDVASPEVQQAVFEVTQNAASIEKFMTNTKVLGVLRKLRTLQEVVRMNGQKKVVFDELMSADPKEVEGKEKSLEKALDDAKQAVMDAVLNDLIEKEKELKKEGSGSTGSSWWPSSSMGSVNSGEASEERKPHGWAEMGREFVRTFLISLLFCAIMAGIALFMKRNPTGEPSAPKLVDEDHFEKLNSGMSLQMDEL